MLTFTPETAEEAIIGDGLSGCASPSTTVITVAETSPVPWVVDSGQPPTRWPSQDTEVALLQLVTRAEGGTVIAPGETVSFQAPPTDIHLTLTPASATAWYGLRKVTDQVTSKVNDGAVEYLAQGKPARRAALTSGLEGFTVGQKLGKAIANDAEALDQVEHALGLAQSGLSAASTCAQAIDDAEVELARSTPSQRSVVTLEDAVSAAKKERSRFGPMLRAALKRLVTIVR